jgi:uncharacterized protein YggU (UPF0235/DUF167 family)
VKDRPEGHAAILELAVTPGAAASAVGPYLDGVLRLRVTRPPSGGEANDAALRLVARELGVAPSRIVLVAGRSSRRKRVRVMGLSPAELARLLTTVPG